MTEQQHKRVIISGGGTGGHIFPAISIAGALQRINPGIEILFVGAEGRMEMEKVPAAGYRIKGLPVAGLVRKISLKNLLVGWKLIKSLRMAKTIIKEFKPHVVVGVGGYASGPVLRVAGRMGIPSLIQEQNSYAGITNRLLAKKASSICVAYEGMEKFFPADKIIFTGNPVRKGISDGSFDREQALSHFGLEDNKPVILVLGGSLGSATINGSILSGIDRFSEAGFQVIWQTGRYYFDRMRREAAGTVSEAIKIMGFIEKMDLAYGIADVIISRAGAGTISELCLAGKPVILVPSPNVAEDHQTMNAKALERRGAALMVSDARAPEELVDRIINLAGDKELRKNLSENILKLAVNDADMVIAKQVIKLAE